GGDGPCSAEPAFHSRHQRLDHDRSLVSRASAFGPAGGLHGATYTVDVEFASEALHPECNWVIDIGLASDLVADVLKKYNYQNLDEVFGKKIMTTTEFMCKEIHTRVVERLREKRQSEDGSDDNDFRGWVKVTLFESHKAWASLMGRSVN
ncbi:hypothetical protein THAOC_06029, partial [Thalassiosira oceanica]